MKTEPEHPQWMVDLACRTRYRLTEIRKAFEAVKSQKRVTTAADNDRLWIMINNANRLKMGAKKRGWP